MVLSAREVVPGVGYPYAVAQILTHVLEVIAVDNGCAFCHYAHSPTLSSRAVYRWSVGVSYEPHIAMSVLDVRAVALAAVVGAILLRVIQNAVVRARVAIRSTGHGVGGVLRRPVPRGVRG